MYCVEMYLHLPKFYVILPYVLCRAVPVVYIQCKNEPHVLCTDVSSVYRRLPYLRYLQCREDCFMYCVEMYLHIPKVYRTLCYVLCSNVPEAYKGVLYTVHRCTCSVQKTGFRSM